MGVGCCKGAEIDFSAEIELAHFDLLQSVGKGAFGKVRVVQHKKDKKQYALKYINKDKCIKMKAVDNIIQERRLLEELDFPLICNLRYAFQDDENMFMVLDLMLGGDLRFHLDRQGAMKEEAVKFYVGEIGLALNHLHERKVIHRDLKPDNVLLDSNGHAHLTDFNIAVPFTDKPLTAVAGSMAYMAPEVLRKKGYFASVDWWSLGVTAYELLFAKRPFRGSTNSELQTSIKEHKLEFPSDAEQKFSKDCIDCLRQLLERDITKRLGCSDGEGFDGFKRHSWLKDLSWEQMANKTAKSPYVPPAERSNFDATHELEELLLEPNPLQVKKRAKPKPGQVIVRSPIMQQIEDQFTVYDYTKPENERHKLSAEELPFKDVGPIGDDDEAAKAEKAEKEAAKETVEGTGDLADEKRLDTDG